MNLGDGEESPWGDVQGNSPRAASPTAAPDAPKSQVSEDTSSPSSSQLLSAPSAPRAPVKTPGGRSPRVNRTPQPTRLEALDDDLGPLGPLGGAGSSSADNDPVDQPPELPQKEQQHIQAARPAPHAPTSQQRPPGPPEGSETSLPFRDGRAPPSQDQLSAVERQHMSALEQASKPTFTILVGDPHKVGDLTSSHTVYQVRTKTNSKSYRLPDFEVSRRYKDFLWVYNQLHINNPGFIVPPPPDKQAVGRFEANFIESRRAAMERMLNKTAAHPILQNDPDLKIFLESDSFNNDVKHRERKDPDMPVESKGVFGGLNLSSGSGGKFVEHDEWFLDRRLYLDNLEGQLKALQKATDTAIAQRKALAEASMELSASLGDLSQVELSPMLTGPLGALADLYVRIKDIYDRQAQQDVLTLGITIDEYIRLIGSIKKAFEQRQRTWHGWHNAESDLQKRKSALDKLMRQGRSQQDKMSQLQADVGDAERRAHQARLQFEDIGKGMRAELERFEKEKVEDFRMGVETFLEASVEAQKELIELWETYLFQLDADDEEQKQTTANPPAPMQPRDADAADSQYTQHPHARDDEDTQSTAQGSVSSTTETLVP